MGINKEDVLNLAEDKINEMFFELQEKLGITSGDISPLQSLELEEITQNLTDLVCRVLVFELENKMDNEN